MKIRIYLSEGSVIRTDLLEYTADEIREALDKATEKTPGVTADGTVYLEDSGDDHLLAAFIEFLDEEGVTLSLCDLDALEEVSSWFQEGDYIGTAVRLKVGDDFSSAVYSRQDTWWWPGSEVESVQEVVTDKLRANGVGDYELLRNVLDHVDWKSYSDCTYHGYVEFSYDGKLYTYQED